MAVVRIHRYTVDGADVDELIARRAVLIAAVRAAHPGLAETQLTRFGDGTFTDAWRWDSAEQMRAALSAVGALPEAGAAMSLVREHSAEDGEIVDER
jgi:hypothetical protein